MSCLSGVRASIGGGRGRGRGDQEEHRCLVGPSHHRLRLLLFNLEQTNQGEGGGRREEDSQPSFAHTAYMHAVWQASRTLSRTNKQTGRQTYWMNRLHLLTYGWLPVIYQLGQLNSIFEANHSITNKIFGGNALLLSIKLERVVWIPLWLEMFLLIYFIAVLTSTPWSSFRDCIDLKLG